MPKFIFIIVGFILIFRFSSACGKVLEEVDTLTLKESISEVIGKDASVTWQKIELHREKSANLKSQLKSKSELPDTLYYGEITQNQNLFYLILDEAPGKTETFIYALYLDHNLKIKDVDVLFYRELHGGEIDNHTFRKQFSGIADPKKMIFGRSIQGITGATISSRSMTYHVRDLLLIFQAVLND